MPLDPNEAPEGYEAVEQIAKSPCEVCAFGHAVADGLCEYPCVPGERRDGANVIFVKRQAPQEAADAEIPNTFKLPGETDDQWIDRITGAQAAPAAVAERGVEGTGLTEAEFAQYARQRKDFSAAPAAAQPVAEGLAEKRIAAIMALVDEFAGARAYAARHPQVANAVRYRDDVRAEVERSVRLVAATPPALVGLSDEQIENLIDVKQPGMARGPSGRRPSDSSLLLAWYRMGAKDGQHALVAANGMTLREGGNG